MTDGASLFRDESDAISPSWWNGPNGSKVRYCMSILWDANAQGFEYAIYARWPDYAPEDALPWIGLDRRITRGYHEGSTSYRSRLIQWVDRWPYSGKPTGVLLAVRGWILPQMPALSIVNNTGYWWSYNEGQDPMPPGASTVTPPIRFDGGGNWNWDGLTDAWWRSWIILSSTTTPWATPAPVWGTAGLKWGDSRYSWGFGQPASQFTGLTPLVGEWKARHCWYPTIIVSFNSALFNPVHPAGGGINPDGNFGHWSKIVSTGGKPAYVRARFSGARYIDGVA